ncbi:hypothetical protein CQW23_24272 [Capsicum baccatum]|uniref:Uncharacterized protein n=1 Tax=Capsicum baccatum TaxID=33114 RepID=A0A2G2VUD9_CAPBA|nr:hypothetical protein CQW23_24272 [Capsicum baccatum]
MTSGYSCGKWRKLGIVGYLLNQSSDKMSIMTTGGEAKLRRELRFLLASFLAFCSSSTSQVALGPPLAHPRPILDGRNGERGKEKQGSNNELSRARTRGYSNSGEREDVIQLERSERAKRKARPIGRGRVIEGTQTFDLFSMAGGFPSFSVYSEGDNGEAPNMFYPQPPSVISNLNSIFLFTSTLRATTSCPLYRLGKGVVERIERTPNRSSRIAPVRWFPRGARQCNTIEEFAPPRKILESKSTTTTICGPFSFSSLPGKEDQKKVVCFSPGRMATYVVVDLPTRMPSWLKSPFNTSKDTGSKETYAKDVFFSALSSPKAKGETASLSFDSSFGFLRIAVAGEKPIFFSLRMREKVRGKNTFSLYEIRKWRTHSIRWVHRIKRKAALSWQSFRWQDTLGLVGASERNESKPKTDQGSLPAKPIGEGLKDGTSKVDRAPVV